jgi:inhibitor of cysteine peptidase
VIVSVYSSRKTAEMEKLMETNGMREVYYRIGEQQGTRKRGPLVFGLLISALLLLLAGCATSTSLTGSDNGKTIQAHVGDEIAIALDANPSTGYAWAIEKSDGTLLTFKQSSFSASSSAIGSGGTQTLTFVAKSVGTVHLQLKYWRSFMGEKSITRRFAVTIQVQA